MSTTENGVRKVKVLSTMELIDANRHAVRKRQNRTLTKEFVDKLDFEGTHVVGMTMPHTNFEGTEGFRVRLLCKLQGTPVPAEVWLDMNPKDYVRLRQVEVPVTPMEPE